MTDGNHYMVSCLSLLRYSAFGIGLLGPLSDRAFAREVVRFVRFAAGDRVAYGIVEEETVHEIEGGHSCDF